MEKVMTDEEKAEKIKEIVTNAVLEVRTLGYDFNLDHSYGIGTKSKHQIHISLRDLNGCWKDTADKELEIQLK